MEVQAVLLVGSCARAQAVPDSCLDITVLLPPDLPPPARAALERAWEEFHGEREAFLALRRVGRYALTEVEFTDGRFEPRPRDWTSGPDSFELDIGNTLVYSVTLGERTPGRLAGLRSTWLPYYGEDLRRERLAATRRYCLNNLDHIPLYVDRGLYFQSLKRLWDAFREFLQALFIARRTYPIAYDKWIREQVAEILGLPDLYRQLPPLFQIPRLESRELVGRSAALRGLLERYTAPSP